MGKVDVLLGLQWGDEGKGKVVDYLTPKYDIIARFQGGPNAGHTLEFDGKKHVLHQIPSGIFHEGKVNIIGNGVVLDPVTFAREIKLLEPYQLDLVKALLISTKAQMIIPTHRFLDQAYEKSKGESKIGSTLRGIGPTYQDKMARIGLRIGDILLPDFDEKYAQLKMRHLEILNAYQIEIELDDAERDFFMAIDILKKFKIINTEYYINESILNNRTILAEGAQGSLLDIDFGSYPFVTSSNTISAGACTGLGVSPKRIGEVYGIFKAYCTRVGSGPFPTELFGNEGEELRKLGNEYGATTGRPRRCGWLDLPALNYAIMLSGVTQLFMMKIDVLSELEEISVCNSYKVDGIETNEFPLSGRQETTPKFQNFTSWGKQSFTGFHDLPPALSKYLKHIEDSVNVPVNIISFGPDRKQTITR